MISVHPTTAKSIENALGEARQLFEDQYLYWRIPRLVSITDTILLKAKKLEMKLEHGKSNLGTGEIEIINLSMWGLIQMDIEPINPDIQMPIDEGNWHYDNTLK